MSDHETRDARVADRIVDEAIGAAVDASRPALRRAYRLGVAEGLRRAANAAPVLPEPVSGPVAGLGHGGGNCGSCGRLLNADGSGHVGVNDDARCDKPTPGGRDLGAELAATVRAAADNMRATLARATSPTGDPTDA